MSRVVSAVLVLFVAGVAAAASYTALRERHASEAEEARARALTAQLAAVCERAELQCAVEDVERETANVWRVEVLRSPGAPYCVAVDLDRFRAATVQRVPVDALTPTACD